MQDSLDGAVGQERVRNIGGCLQNEGALVSEHSCYVVIICNTDLRKV